MYFLKKNLTDVCVNDDKKQGFSGSFCDQSSRSSWDFQFRAKCIHLTLKMYVSKIKNVFVKLEKCICQN